MDVWGPAPGDVRIVSAILILHADVMTDSSEVRPGVPIIFTGRTGNEWSGSVSK